MGGGGMGGGCGMGASAVFTDFSLTTSALPHGEHRVPVSGKGAPVDLGLGAVVRDAVRTASSGAADPAQRGPHFARKYTHNELRFTSLRELVSFTTRAVILAAGRRPSAAQRQRPARGSGAHRHAEIDRRLLGTLTDGHIR